MVSVIGNAGHQSYLVPSVSGPAFHLPSALIRMLQLSINLIICQKKINPELLAHEISAVVVERRFGHVKTTLFTSQESAFRIAVLSSLPDSIPLCEAGDTSALFEITFTISERRGAFQPSLFKTFYLLAYELKCFPHP